MNINPTYLLTAFAISIISISCSGIVQKNIAADAFSNYDFESGIIVGSVTAPFILHYHETVLFHYRSVDDDGQQNGVLTSGTQHKIIYPYPFVPLCDSDSLESQCGRLFAVQLPVGNYEIYRVVIIGREDFQIIEPLLFKVEKEKTSYLGNLHMTFCQGLVRNTRGNILGGDISIKDEFDRDIVLLKRKYNGLSAISIKKQLLQNTFLRWRISYEPFDWGDCGQNSHNSMK